MPDHAELRKHAAKPEIGILGETTPDGLVPQLNKAVSEVAHYQTLHVTGFLGELGPLKEVGEPLDPFGETADTAYGQKPAVGVLLTHAQSWEQTGLALGTLLHSVCLAPGEVTKIAMIDWRRQTGARATEGIDEGERLENEARQNRAVSEVQDTVARETKSGRTTSTGKSTTSEGGSSGSFFGMFGGSSGSSTTTTEAMTATMSVGQRHLSATANQNVHQRTMEASQAARSRRATVVKEVQESETETLTTRVVANYNHMHALSVLYFEVLQIFALKTKVSAAERCIFIPMELIAFTPEAIDRHQESLLAVATELGLDDLRHVLLNRIDPKRLASLERKTGKQAKSVSLRWGHFASGLVELDKLAAARAAALDKKVKNFKGSLAQELEQAPERGRAIQAVEAFTPLRAALQEAIAQVESASADSVSVVIRQDVIEDVEKRLLKEVLVKLRPFADLKYGTVSDVLEKAETLLVACGKLGRHLADLHQLETKLDAATAADRVGKERLRSALERDRLFFSQQIWLRMDSHRVCAILANRMVDDQPLLGRVDPTPVGVFGNYVAYRWNFRPRAVPGAEPDALMNAPGKAVEDDDQRRLEFLYSVGLLPDDGSEDGPLLMDPRTRYTELNDTVDGAFGSKTERTAMIALPSDGLFAEAVLGKAISAEKIDLSRFWKWEESPIPILPPEMEAIRAGSRARDVDVSLGQLGASIVKLFGPQAMPEPVDMKALIEALSQHELFGKMPLEQTSELARVISETSARGASHAADTALAANKAMLDAMADLAKTAGQVATGSDASVIGGLLNVNPNLLKAKGNGAAGAAKGKK